MTDSLINLPNKSAGVIRKIESDCKEKRRLNSLGLITGVKINLVRKAPFGSPKIYRCLNTLVAIRDEVAKEIEVEFEV